MGNLDNNVQVMGQAACLPPAPGFIVCSKWPQYLNDINYAPTGHSSVGEMQHSVSS